MNPIRQKTNYDCFNSCIASITGIPQEKIPLFVDNPARYIETARKWLRSQGYALSSIKHVNDLDGRCNSIVAVDAYEFNGIFAAHAVVMHRSRVVHDPARRRIKKNYDILCGWEVRRL